MEPVRISKRNPLYWLYQLSVHMGGLFWLLNGRFETAKISSTCFMAWMLILSPLTVGAGWFLTAWLIVLASFWAILTFVVAVAGVLLGNRFYFAAAGVDKAIPFHFPRFWGIRLPVIPTLLYGSLVGYLAYRVAPTVAQKSVEVLTTTISSPWTWISLLGLAAVIAVATASAFFVKALRNPATTLGALYQSLAQKTCRPVEVVD